MFQIKETSYTLPRYMVMIRNVQVYSYSKVVIDKKGNGHKIEAVELMSYNRNKNIILRKVLEN